EPHSKPRALGLADERLRRPHPSRFVMELAGGSRGVRCTRADDDEPRSARRPVRRWVGWPGAAEPGAAVSVPLAARPADGPGAAVRGWVLDPGCRLVTVLGIGGVGKTLLAARVARDVAADVGRVYWRSLRDAPTPADWLAGALGFLDPDRSVAAEGARLDRLLG